MSNDAGANEWKTGTAADVKPGDRIRTPAGEELLVSRIEAPFFGRPEMIAFIEDTPERWYKRPVPVDVELEIQH
jgi:hypothetical protein